MLPQRLRRLFKVLLRVQPRPGLEQKALLIAAAQQTPGFLDEATSHLDVETERQVLQNLKGLGITMVMSAHRPDAIALADRVYALNTQSWLRG